MRGRVVFVLESRCLASPSIPAPSLGLVPVPFFVPVRIGAGLSLSYVVEALPLLYYVPVMLCYTIASISLCLDLCLCPVIV